MMRNYKIYVSVLCVLVLAGCQKNGLENQDLSDGAVKYAVVMNQLAGTKAGDNGSVASESDEQTVQPQTGGLVTLKDQSGSISIPVECEVTEGIFKSSVTVATKGTQVNTTDDDKAMSLFHDIVGKFTANAYGVGGTDPLFTQNVEWKTDKWVGSPVAYWPQATSLNFLASANLPESEDVATVSFASTGVTLNYKSVPEDASAQKDILLGWYQGNGGGTGTADICFEHPLTAVRFLYGDIDGNPSIKSITLVGVAASYTATMAPDGEITPGEVSDYSKTVSQNKSEGLDVDIVTGLIGEPFIIVPQDLEGHNVMLTVILSTDSGDVPVTATINAGEWKAGYTSTYRISSEALTSLTIMVDDRVSGSVKDNLSVSNAGNCDAYFRVALVGNWKNNSGEIIECWDETQGTFANFPGTDWIKIGGYYYYRNPVDKSAGADAYTEIESKLFSSYTAPEPPEPGASLSLDIIVQAVKYDVLKQNVSEAWGSSVAGMLNTK